MKMFGLQYLNYPLKQYKEIQKYNIFNMELYTKLLHVTSGHIN